MRRREFITLLSGAAVWPITAHAQQAERIRPIGVLMPFAKDNPEGQARIAAFLQEMQKLGWTEGRNLQIEYRWDTSDLPKAATELVTLHRQVGRLLSPKNAISSHFAPMRRGHLEWR
jgi:hypothetical protein